MIIMRSQLLSISLASLAAAFSDTAPFFQFSSRHDSHVHALPNEAIHSASAIEEDIISNVPCGKIARSGIDAFVLVSQPSIRTSDFATTRSAPHLARRLQQPDAFVATARGNVTLVDLADTLKSECGASLVELDSAKGVTETESDTYPQVITIEMPHLPHCEKKRAEALRSADVYLNSVLSNLDDLAKSWTVYYATTTFQPLSKSASSSSYRFDDYEATEGLHMDLKRDTTSHLQLKRQHDDDESSRGLFETYAFLNQGVFAGLVALSVLLPILYIGFSALNGLQISEASFTKEQAQAGQRKAQ